MTEPDVASDNHVQARENAALQAHDASLPAELPPGGYGARLARERERAGLGVSDVAATLRLHPNQVRAIEQEDLTRLPEPAYVRGFIRSYARLLNVDAAPMLADLNAKLAPSSASVVDAMTTIRDFSPVRAAARERRSRQMVVGVALVGLIALGVVGWQSTQRGESAAPAPQASASLAPAQAAPLPVADTAQSTPDDQAVQAASLPSPADDASPAAAADADGSARTAAPMLVLRFSGRSWVEVTDANGKVLVSELSSAGIEHELNGAAPLTVVIGDANVTSVNVHGEVFNLQPFTRDKVARFTVKAR